MLIDTNSMPTVITLTVANLEETINSPIQQDVIVDQSLMNDFFKAVKTTREKFFWLPVSLFTVKKAPKQHRYKALKTTSSANASS